MEDYDKKQKWIRVVLDHSQNDKILQTEFVQWVQNKDGSYKSILKSEGCKAEVTSFPDENAFRQQVFHFLHALTIDDDPYTQMQVDAKATPSIVLRVDKLKDPFRRTNVFQYIKNFFRQ